MNNVNKKCIGPILVLSGDTMGVNVIYDTMYIRVFCLSTDLSVLKLGTKMKFSYLVILSKTSLFRYINDAVDKPSDVVLYMKVF